MQKVLTLQEKDEWCRYLSILPTYCQDVYFTPAYYSLYETLGDGKACCFVYEHDGNLALYPFLINNISSLGYNLNKEYYDIQGAYGYNGLITSSNDDKFISAFWNVFADYCKNHDIIAEFTRFHPLLNNQTTVAPDMHTIYSRHTVWLNLENSIDDIWHKEFSSKNRNMIRKAEKCGIVVEESNDYDSFQTLYNETMRRLDAEDYFFFPNSYYHQFKETLDGHCMLLLAFLNDKIIAGSMFMFWGNYCHYHLSARDNQYSKYAANNLILWEAIKKGTEKGCKYFHFGGGTTSNDNDSLLKFKENFSTTKSDFYIGKRVYNPIIYQNIVDQWKEKYPKSFAKNNKMLLGYRELY